VIGGFYHELFDRNTADYDVAVLEVCTKFNMEIYIETYIMYVQ